MELVGSERGQDDDPCVRAVPREEGEEIERGWVGPMDILDDEQDTPVLGQRSEPGEDAFEEARLDGLDAHAIALPGRTRASGARQQSRELQFGRTRNGPQGLDEWCERQRGSTDDAGAHERDPTEIAGLADDLVDESGLADAGLAGEEDQRGAAANRVPEDVLDLPQLRFAPHECRIETRLMGSIMGSRPLGTCLLLQGVIGSSPGALRDARAGCGRAGRRAQARPVGKPPHESGDVSPSVSVRWLVCWGTCPRPGLPAQIGHIARGPGTRWSGGSRRRPRFADRQPFATWSETGGEDGRGHRSKSPDRAGEDAHPRDQRRLAVMPSGHARRVWSGAIVVGNRPG